MQMPRRPGSVYQFGTVVSVTSFNVAKLGQLFLIGLRIAASQIGHGIHPLLGRLVHQRARSINQDIGVFASDGRCL